MKSTLRREPASVIDFLKRHDGTAAMLPAAERLLDLQRDTLALIPPALHAVCTVSGLDAGTMTLRVSSASAAAKLRQTLPRVSDGLQRRGWKVSGIRIRVQPRNFATESETWVATRTLSMSPAGVAAFQSLGDGLDESPLKAAVARLLARRLP